jgi:7-keto-8-aminopelargonate synthetase-like enzyme
LVELKKKYDACLIVDEAHALGCIGPEGKGCAAESGLLGDVDIVVGTFSKALGGAGGFVAADKSIVEILINKARPFIYTTGVPAVHCLAAEAALDIIDCEPQRREKLNENARILRSRLNEMGLNTASSDSYIIPVVIGDAHMTVDLSVKLWEAGIMIPAIRPPTVAPGSSRLRISLMSEHTPADLDRLFECLQNFMTKASV